MKIGIVTKIGKNYGAVLQAYALKKKLCDMGHEAHIIKYTPEFSRKSYALCKYSWSLGGTLANLKFMLHFKEYKKSTERFYEFRNDFYDFLGGYNTDDEIEANPPKCDIYITGSDQVWNPPLAFDRSFYCMFADRYPDSKRAAYAASIGLAKIPEQYSPEFKERVQRFDYISVREKKAVSILNEMGIEAKIAPDPTLLHSKEDWHPVAVKPEIEEPYILCYFVSYPSGIEKVVEQFKRKYGLKVVNLMTAEASAGIGDIKIRDAGPREFLGLFEHASYVITSSFHGTVFSLINKKPFVVTLYKNTSSRVTELLENFELSDRIITPDCTDIEPYCNGAVYSEQHDKKLEAMRARGAEILNEISGVN